MARKKQGTSDRKPATGRKTQAKPRKKTAAAQQKKATPRKTQKTTQKTAQKITRKTAQKKTASAKMNHYRPSDSEVFMNERMTEYFRHKLLQWRSDLLQESSETLMHLQESSTAEPDLADRASLETDRSLELRTRDRERKLLAKIDAALERIEDGTYGYCEETMEPISIRRLEARPIATLSIEAQERHERMERTQRDD